MLETLLCFTTFGIMCREEKCMIEINDFHELEPLILYTESRRGFIYPEEPGNDVIVIKSGDLIRVACPGGRVLLSRSKIKLFESALFECISDKTFSLTYENRQGPFFEIYCETYPQHIVRRTFHACGAGIIGEIGFSIKIDDHEEFVGLIDFCHDENISHTIYAHTEIPAAIDSAEILIHRPSFIKGDFYRGISMDTIYNRFFQQETLEQILKSRKLANRYIQDTGNYFLSRGHLIAKNDFIYGAQQRATFYYVNTVPMWQNINDGNWKQIEISIRNYASTRNCNLEIWTGSLGVLELRDVNGKNKKIYLEYQENERLAIPVPKLLFKVVYNRKNKAGIVFITINNPHLNRLTRKYFVCNDVCAEINFVNWDMRRNRGYSYCCRVDDFRNAFPDLPEFTTHRLLS